MAVPMIMSVTVTVTVTASVGVFVAHGNNSRLTCWVRLHTL
ncbi:putative membrane protein [Pseudomonas aeruginosa]|nr:putative membrane protein [Pseudomonas aeruginosa]RAL76536.1 putative membrane protein [Pseudomonas aeruginosa]